MAQVLLVIHGFLETDEVWDEVFEDSDLPMRSVLLPGHGWRPCSDDTTHASIALQLAATINPSNPVDVIGYSMGGRTALRLALDHPDRVRSLTLISTTPGARNEDERQYEQHREDMQADVLEEDGIGTFVAEWEANPILKPARPMPRSLCELIRSRRLNQHAPSLAVARRCLGRGAEIGPWDHLGRVQCPTLLIAGATDQRYCDLMQAMCDAMPRARLAIVPECGHAVHRECPRDLVRLVTGFLEQFVPASAGQGGDA